MGFIKRKPVGGSPVRSRLSSSISYPSDSPPTNWLPTTPLSSSLCSLTSSSVSLSDSLSSPSTQISSTSTTRFRNPKNPDLRTTTTTTTRTKSSSSVLTSSSSRLLYGFLIFSAIFFSFATCFRYGPKQRPQSFDDYDRNDWQSRVQTSRVSSSSSSGGDSQQRQVPVRNRFEWNSEGRSTPRYEWSNQYYRTSSTTSTTTTTTERPAYGSSQYHHQYSHNQERTGGSYRPGAGGDGGLSQGVFSVPRIVDDKYLPGSRTLYENWHGNRTRGYDADLDGPTLPPPIVTEDEEEWDGTDFYRKEFDSKHPLAIYTSPKCDEYQACYPATGNLLIGRENRLKASSTCGLRNAVRYCVVSHLKEKKKCFYCDSREQFKGTGRYHGIENIVSRIGKKRRQFWWQAENGIEGVSVQFDLEAEFHFTHLVITFKTFRPAAMLIERSHDFGRTWHVYQYFAYDCAQSFPGVKIGVRYNITDVVCDNTYSGVEPSTEGEVIFRVLPPNIHINDPYSKEVQDLLKITNLRINFTRLHNLGDNLLDPRNEIKEKYYYAIYDMVVRGSCSCYGHASRCIPEETDTIPDMVYGRCECTHHTKGRNCELCEELYNDLEWRPALGRETNPCKKCNCHNHANRCHFDRAVYTASQNISGGVCDDCQHNTMGHNCERCKPYYFRDPLRPLEDPYVCQQCDCDPRGSEDDGLCDEYTEPETGMEAGKCHCKNNVEGRRCDHCKPGFWNMDGNNSDGCEACSCNKLGTVGNLGCNVNTGECVCKRNVVGRDCNQCAPNYYGLSEDEEGCKFCDCDPGGSYSQSCDQETGKCQCRPHVTGRRCDTPEENHFVPLLDYLTYEGENAKTTSGEPQAQVTNRQPYDDRTISWSGPGFMRVGPQTSMEFVVDDLPESKLYDIVVRYEPLLEGRWDDVRLSVERPLGIDPYGPCKNYLPTLQDRQTITLALDRYAVSKPICLEKNSRYRVLLETNGFSGAPHGGEPPSILIDSIAVIPRPDDIPFFIGTPENDRRRQEFERFRCHATYYTLNRSPTPDEYCRKSLKSVGFQVFNGAYSCDCDLTGSTSRECESLGGNCNCKSHVAERTCSRCHVGYYGFGPEGCKACDCHGYGSMDNFCNTNTGQCNCRTGTYGRQCDECQPGYWNYPNCQRCNCNGFSDLCDSKTGTCLNCRDNTAGPHCDQCARGFYGDPLGTLTGNQLPCRNCPCPGVEGSGTMHAETCELDRLSQNVICNCQQGYTGERCDRCDENYYGDPNIPEGQCLSCECNNNIDVTVAGSCDRKTGKCLKCLYNTAGSYCEECKPGYYGKALEQSCAQCVCHHLGTDPRSAFCNQTSGQCSCLANVEGQSCDRCADNHWNITSGTGCDACDCDPQGSYSMKCNEIDGQCHCKPTFGGRRCDECLPNHWGDPRVQCQQCECNLSGSQTVQCDKSTGHCVCIPGISGNKCDRCARGFTGIAPHCEACGECFESWDLIIQTLKNDTFALLDKARNIKNTGTTGIYTPQFTMIEENLNEVDKILKGQDINEMDLDQVQHMITESRDNLDELQDILNGHERNLEDTKTKVINVNAKLDMLVNQSQALKLESERFKEEATLLQEANVEGAYTIVKDAQHRSRISMDQIRESVNILYDSETKRNNTETLIENAKDQHNLNYMENDAALKGIQQEIDKMENDLPNINHLVCDGKSTIDNCDTLCGGAGCGRCGGISCTKGATTKASTAVEMARNAETELLEKDRLAKDELRRITDAREKSEEALKEARAAFERIMISKNASTETAIEVSDLLKQIESFLQDESAKPAEIRALAENCKNLEISLDPKQIENLALEINKTIAGLKDIERILDETKDSLAQANDLKVKASLAKDMADSILTDAESVKAALEEARLAQAQAKKSIDDANVDIDSIDRDLREITQSTEIAKTNADEAKDKIGKLNKRLSTLTPKFTSNKYNIQNAENEALNATAYAKDANQLADELQKKYQLAEQKLDQKSRDSDKFRNRANDLKNVASQLYNNLSNKLSKIANAEEDISQNERKITDYQNKINELNEQMKNHLEHIEKRSKHYRDCQA